MNASFISDSLFRAFSLDAKLSSHPVEVECPDDNMVHGVSFTPPPPSPLMRLLYTDIRCALLF